MSDTQQRDMRSDSRLNPGPRWHGPDDDEIDLFELAATIWRGKWLIIACTAIGAAAAITFALLSEDIYEAKVIVFPVGEQQSGGLASLGNQFGGLASLAGVDIGGGGGETERALERLKSFAFTRSFIETNDLMPILFADLWDTEAGEWRLEDGDHSPPTVQQAVGRFESEVRQVSTNQDSGAITIKIAWREPELAANWANQLVARLNQEIREHDVSEAQRSIRFLEQKLKETTVVELQQTIFRLIESQTKTVMLASVREEYAFTVVDPAYIPDNPSEPKRLVMLALGIMLGGFAGVIIVLLRNAIGNHMARPEKL